MGDYALRELAECLGPQWDIYMAEPLQAMALDVTSEEETLIPLARVLLKDPNWLPPSSRSSENVNSMRMLTWVDDEGRPCFAEGDTDLSSQPRGNMSLEGNVSWREE